MQAFIDLLQNKPLIFVHMIAALAALVIGGVVLARRKGTATHKAWGWSWVLLMGTATVSSAFIHDYKLPNLWGYTPIHAFTVFSAITLPRGIWYIRTGNVTGHRRAMRSLYIGGCIVAGVFTLLPTRFLGGVLWRSLGLMA